jgi:hypothetical protein
MRTLLMISKYKCAQPDRHRDGEAPDDGQPRVSRQHPQGELEVQQ